MDSIYKTVKVWREDVNYLGQVTKISANMPIGRKFTNCSDDDVEAGIEFYLKRGWHRVDPAPAEK